MHQQQRRTTRFGSPKRILAGAALAMTLSTTAVLVAVWDPTEALCSIYTDSDPMWHLLACWRFPRT